MSDDDGFTAYVSKREKKEKRIIRAKEKNRSLRTFLLSDELKDICVLWLIDRCRKGGECRYKHPSISDGVNAFARSIYKDFTYIKGVGISRNNILKFLISKFKDNVSINLVNCTFYNKGITCKNEECGRFIEFPMKFNDKKIVVHICHSVVNKFRSHVLCGMHIDFMIDEKHSRYDVIDIISNKDNRIFKKKHGRFLKTVRENDIKNIDTSSVNDFPELSDRASVSSISTYTSDGSELKKTSSYSKAVETVQNPFRKKRLKERKIVKTDSDNISVSKMDKGVKDSVELLSSDGAKNTKSVDLESSDYSKSDVGVKIIKMSHISESKKTKLSMLNDDDYEKLANDIFNDEIDEDESLEEKVKRLEKENIILFKRNIQLMDKLQYSKTYNAYQLNRDSLLKRFGQEFVKSLDYIDSDDEFGDLDDLDDFDIIGNEYNSISTSNVVGETIPKI